MSDETELPEDTTIHKMVVDENYKQEALNRIRNMVKGNKLDPEEVKIENFDGEILRFQAENILTILTKITNKKVTGRIEGPVVVDNDIAAKEAMNKAYLSLTDDSDMERQIRDILLKRDDKGFALDNNIIPIPFWKKEFAVFEPCFTCDTNGIVKCLPCDGKGVNQCPRCNGVGRETCGQCNGAGLVPSQNGVNISCPNCQGSGYRPCSSCGQSGQIKCRTCGSKGSTTCPSCQGSAWNSNICILEIEIRTAFDYPKDKLPEKVVVLIDKYGAKIREHADITISEEQTSVVNLHDEEKAQLHEEADKRNDIRIPLIFEVFLPYGHVEYNINGKIYYTFLFGKQGHIIHVSPFIDDLIKNGVRKLHDAAEDRGSISDNLKQASEYRTIKEGIFYTVMNSKSNAKALLKKSNSLGLSDDTAKDIIEQITIAMDKITNKPRNIGLAISAIFNLLAFSIYFITPARDYLLSFIPNMNLHIISDILVLLGTMYIGNIIIQMTAQSAVKNIMSTIGINKSAPPKLGSKLYWNIGVSATIFTGVIEVSRQILSTSLPAWYMNFFI